MLSHIHLPWSHPFAKWLERTAYYCRPKKVIIFTQLYRWKTLEKCAKIHFSVLNIRDIKRTRCGWNFKKRLLCNLTVSTLRSKQCFPTSRTAITRLANIRFILSFFSVKLPRAGYSPFIVWCSLIYRLRYMKSGASTKYFLLFKYVRNGGQQ